MSWSGLDYFLEAGQKVLSHILELYKRDLTLLGITLLELDHHAECQNPLIELSQGANQIDPAQWHVGVGQDDQLFPLNLDVAASGRPWYGLGVQKTQVGAFSDHPEPALVH